MGQVPVGVYMPARPVTRAFFLAQGRELPGFVGCLVSSGVLEARRVVFFVTAGGGS